MSMLASSHPTLEDNIIDILTQKGRMETTEMQAALVKYGAPPTIQGIYRVLRKLQRGGVIVKEKKSYSLRMAWVMDLGHLVGKMESTYFTSPYMSELLPSQIGEKYSWNFRDYLKMTDFWSQLLLSMTRASKRKVALHYCPHSWFDLIEREQEKQFLDAFFGMLDQDYIIIGGRTPLDTVASEMYKPYPKEHCYLAKPEEFIDQRRTHYWSVIGEYVLTAKVSERGAEKIDAFYAETPMDLARNEERIFTLLLKLIKEKSNIKISVKRDPVLAQKYYKKFEKIFGPLEPNSRGNIATQSIPEHMRHTS